MRRWRSFEPIAGEVSRLADRILNLLETHVKNRPSDWEEAVEVMGERQVATMVAAIVGVAIDFGFNVGLESSPGIFSVSIGTGT